MDELSRALRRFRIRLMLRVSAYAALWGLLIALILVIAAPWLRQMLGAPDFFLTLALPVVLPGMYVLWVWVRRPDRRTIVQAADAWSGNTGAVVSGYELGREHPDSPFIRPVVARAVGLVRKAGLPEPRPLRWALTALVVMLALVPLSRWAHAQMQSDEEEKKQQQAARKTDVPPEQAEKLAKEAGNAAEKAKQARARAQEKLADDIEQAAREAQAGGKDKEKALREAHSLADRARSQREAQDARKEARDALAQSEITRELAEAIENADPAAVNREAAELAKDLQKPDGSLDPDKAKKLEDAVDDAQRLAPGDANLRKAAESLKKAVSPQALDNTERAREQMKQSLTEQGKTAEEIENALKNIGELDKEALKQQIEELGRQLSPLRDLDPSGNEMQELLEKLKDMQISPEQARELAETARELSQRLEIDAETLREMLKEGRKFEGLDELAKQIAEKAKAEGNPLKPGEVPDWAQKALPQEWKDAALKPGKPGGKLGNSGRDEGKNPDGKGQGGTEDTGVGSNKGPGTKPVEGGGKEGVDAKDTGQGAKNADGKEERLDPDKAKDEKATRNNSGTEGTGKGINTREEEERLPRRYRDSARKYFER